MPNRRPRLKSSAILKHDAAVPARKHGTKFFISVPIGSELKVAADQVPERDLMSEGGWGAIVGQMKLAFSAYFEMDLEVSVEETISRASRERVDDGT